MSPIRGVEIDWNYAPQGSNVCKGLSFENSGAAALWGSAGLGSTLKKGKFFAYTDDTYTTKVEVPPEELHLGLLGPLIRAAPGDVIEVTLKNTLNIDLLLDPQGLVPRGDKTSSLGPTAEAGETVTYTWDVPPEAAPGPDDPDTKMYLYRSVVYPEASDNAGLIGPILISRQGAPARPQEGRDIVTVMQILDENVSPFYSTNVNATYEELGLESKYALEESLLKHAVNGYVFCNSPDLNMTQGEKVRWHSAAMGSEGDMHNAHWHGSTFLLHGHRGDNVKMFPGSTLSLDFTPREAGTWLLHCHVNDHIHAGMMALYTVAPAAQPLAEATAVNSTVRSYFIGVDEVDWNYAPLDGDACKTGKPEAWGDYATPFVEVTTGMAGPKYLKAQYHEYTDATFATKKPRSTDQAYMGILGPVIRAEVGDTIEITLRNNLKSLQKAISMHPHGVAYNKDSEGANYNDGTTGADRLDDLVAPGETVKMTWTVPETAGPGPTDPSTIGWMYHSHSDEVADPLAGLVGVLVIGRPGSMATVGTALGTAKDVDREVFYIFSVMNERSSFMWPVNEAAITARDTAMADSWLTATTPAGTASAPAAAATARGAAAGRRLAQAEEEPAEEPSLLEMAEGEEVENDLMHGVNGYIYCNNPVLRLSRGDNVRFHVISVGTEVDMHSATLSGSTFSSNGQRGPAVGLLAGSMHTSDVAVVAPAGPAILQCRVADHIEAGMQSLILVEDKAQNGTTTLSAAAGAVAALSVLPANATTRQYFVQAEEGLWDYGPEKKNMCGAEPEPYTDGESLFMDQVTGETIGSVYRKAFYRRFTSKDFDRRVPAPQRYGILGPVFAAEVNEILDITFRNSLSYAANLRFDAGFVPVKGSADPAKEVAPGETVQYLLAVPESSGPGPSDLNTVTYGYTSSVDLVYHPYSGLLGLALVGSPGAFQGLDPSKMPAEPVPAGVDGIMPLVLAVMNEGETLYLEENADLAGVELAADEGRRRLAQAEGEAEAAAGGGGSLDFEESNLMHAINGFMYCNMPEVHVESGKTLRLAVLGLGSETDLHSLVFSGQSLTGAPKDSPRGAIEPLMPASTMSANLKASTPGRWLFACLVHDHDEAGMKAILSVDEPNKTANAGVVAGGRAALWLAVLASILAILL